MYAIKLGSEFSQHKLADKGFKEPDLKLSVQA